ncbi:MAG: hypothetical protein IID61_00510 [SAR324 cluster bacterium]|nr:hypothetical protein [SAR324 cluster bacterium]
MKRKFLFLLAGLALLAFPAQALEVDEVSLPRIQFEGEFISTIDYFEQPGAKTGPRLAPNTNDNNVIFAFDKHLWNSSIVAGIVTRIRLEDNEAQPRLFGFLGAPRYRISAGTMRLRNNLVRFPTAREEDLLTYTNVLNGSLGFEIEDDPEHLFGDNIVFEWFFRPSFWRAAVFSENRTQTKVEDFALRKDAPPNTLGFSISYEVPDAVKYDYVLRRLGFIYDAQALDRRSGDAAQLSSLLLGGVLALNDNPEFPWEGAFQVITTAGLDDRDSSGNEVGAQAEGELSREAATATVLSVFYANRKYLRTRWDVALTLARKSYPDISGGAQWTAAPTYRYALSSGVHLIAQVIYTDYGDGLAEIIGRDRDYRIQVGVTMFVEQAVNDEVVDYDSILEMEQGSLFRGY